MQLLHAGRSPGIPSESRRAFSAGSGTWPLERDRGIHFTRKFIVPVVVDATAEPGGGTPPLFATQLHLAARRQGDSALCEGIGEIVSGS